MIERSAKKCSRGFLCQCSPSIFWMMGTKEEDEKCCGKRAVVLVVFIADVDADAEN